MDRRGFLRGIIGLTLAGGLLVGCGAPQATPVPVALTPTPTSVPLTATPTPEEPTATPEPTSTPEPTATPEPTTACPPDREGDFRAIHLGVNSGLNTLGVKIHPPDYFAWLESLCVNWVGIQQFLYVDDSMDSTVERKYAHETFHPLGGCERECTYTDEDLVNTIDAFHQHGFHVYLTLAFSTSDTSEWAEHPVARYQLGDPKAHQEYPEILPEFWPWRLDHPDHESFVSEFWETYTQQAVYFGELAEAAGVEMYSLGTETERLFRSRPGGYFPNDFNEELNVMVDSVRSVYSGMLTYDMYSGALAAPDFFGPGPHHLWEDLGLDVVGISAYFPLVDTVPSTVLSVTTLEESWERIFDDYLVPLKNRNPDLPIVFLEFGYTDTIESPYEPNYNDWELRIFEDANENGLDDGEETQANIYEAFFNVRERRPGIVAGAFLHDHPMSSDEDWAKRDGFVRHSVRGNLAEEVIRSHYSRSGVSVP